MISDSIHFDRRRVHQANYHPVIAVEYFGERWISVMAVKVALAQKVVGRLRAYQWKGNR